MKMLNKKDDGLNAARGLFSGVLLAIPCWVVIYYVYDYLIGCQESNK